MIGQFFHILIELIPYLVFTVVVFLVPTITIWLFSERVSFRMSLLWVCRFLPSGWFHAYYPSDRVVRADDKARLLADICHHGYVDTEFDDDYERLSERHFPSIYLINWARSIADDLTECGLPINRVIQWDDYLRSCGRGIAHSVHPAFIDFEEHELAYLWGAVYYWLKCLTKGSVDEELLDNIEQVACRKKYARAYFSFFKVQAGGEAVEEEAPAERAQAGFSNGEMSTFVYAVAMMTEGEMPSKSRLAPVISRISGHGESAVSQKLKGSFSQKDKSRVASVIRAVMPQLAEKVEKL